MIAQIAATKKENKRTLGSSLGTHRLEQHDAKSSSSLGTSLSSELNGSTDQGNKVRKPGSNLNISRNRSTLNRQPHSAPVFKNKLKSNANTRCRRRTPLSMSSSLKRCTLAKRALSAPARSATANALRTTAPPPTVCVVRVVCVCVFVCV